MKGNNSWLADQFIRWVGADEAADETASPARASSLRRAATATRRPGPSPAASLTRDPRGKRVQ
jgi:hypothetical protein